MKKCSTKGAKCRVGAILLLAVVAAGLAGCGTAGEKVDNKQPDENQEKVVTESESASDSEEITVDDVRNHPETPASDFEYLDHGDSVSIKAYNGSDPIVVIPEQIDGKDVISIIDGPFTNGSFVKGISLPDTIKELEWTFGNNKSLQIVLASGVETVGEGTFNCNSSLKYVDLGDNLKEFTGDNFFTSALEKIHIAASAENLDKAFFSDEGTVTIVGAAGSYAETFSKECGIKFETE